VGLTMALAESSVVASPLIGSVILTCRMGMERLGIGRARSVSREVDHGYFMLRQRLAIHGFCAHKNHFG